MKDAAVGIRKCPDVFHMRRQIERGSRKVLYVLAARSRLDENNEDDNGNSDIYYGYNNIMIMHML